MAEPLTGRCACGAVRYQLTSAPFDTGWCHCRTCQLNSGAPAMVFASVPHGDFVFTQGADNVRRFASSSFGYRRFCGACGTPFTMEVDHQPETVDFSVATLDRPEAVAPGFHIFWASRIGWFDPGDDLPRHDRFRPDTRGLDGTDPPE
ncbi:GFA family protein [Sphingomonas parva]|uniref:GFA family protein n=1 Tax=Sphingomonas parva TaxID=2555898 RepID=A0A4Y8ZW32_9SPHN|nr:GFA family protein [Sphingomonas parva]TFI60243.1 GFA family protein [Sphingomonas parva]